MNNTRLNNLLHEMAGSEIDDLDQLNDDIMDQSQDDNIHDKNTIKGVKLA